MLAPPRHNDQGNVIHVGVEGAEGEGEFHDTEGRGEDDDRGAGAPIPKILATPTMEEPVDVETQTWDLTYTVDDTPWIPCHLTLWIS